MMSNLIKSSSTSGPTKKTLYKVPLPLSLSLSPLSRFLSYFTLFTLFSSSPAGRIKGKYDEKSQAVIICNREDMEKLWREGFFGKGSLSRSEPTWFWRNSKNDKVKGKGKQKLAAEQVTEQRRIARRRNKMGRVNQVQKVGKTQQDEEDEIEMESSKEVEVVKADENNQQEEQEERQIIEQNAKELSQEEELKDTEKLILTTQEAFFLCYGLGILDIYDSQDVSSYLHFFCILNITIITSRVY
jgi:tRNA-splicing endonuclease subunit Sen2